MFFCLIHAVFEQKIIVFGQFLKSGGIRETVLFFFFHCSLKFRGKQFKELPQSANL